MTATALPVVDGGGRKPRWLGRRLPSGPRYERLRALVEADGLVTVCASARCPNIGECWSKGTATFMLMGNLCTRGCRFCHVPSGKRPGPLESEEPARVARAVSTLALDYAVLTSVCRDDLADHGAAHLAATVRAVRESAPAKVEILIPDLAGDEGNICAIVEAGPSVLAHNVETVPRLSSQVRDPRARFDTSLRALETGARLGALMKSGLMLGLGEREDEVVSTLRALKDAGVSLLTLGQYLQPDPTLLPVSRYLPPEEFDGLADVARGLGFKVAAGPLVRSSFDAARLFEEAMRGEPARGELA